MFRFPKEEDTQPAWVRVYERFIPAEPRIEGASADDPEVLDDVKDLDRLPTSPFAFARFVVATHFPVRIVALYLTIITAVVLDSLTPYVLNRLIDALTVETIDPDTVMMWLFALAGTWIGVEIGLRLFDIQDVYVGPRLRALTQKYLFRYTLGHSPQYFQDNFAGRLTQKIRSAGDSLTSLKTLMVRDLTMVLTVLVMGFILLGMESYLFMVILGVWAVIYMGVSTYLARHCAILSYQMSDRWSSVTGKLVDSISNADAVRSFAKGEHERRYVSRYLFRGMTATMRMRWFVTVMRAFQGMAMWALKLVMIGVALWLTVRGQMTIGGFSMVFLLVTMIASNLRALSFQVLDFFEHLGNLSESLELVGTPHDITDKPGAPALHIEKAAIRFEDVHFAHADGTPVFESLSLDIAPGEKVGLVGRSGAGKSTLVKLLRRHYEPQKGRILIDGQEVRDVTWDSVNEAIAEVPQVPAIFHRTVRDNIRYAYPMADNDEVLTAARHAHADGFIARRHLGFETIVGEQGIKLSGGERQRVAIARAFVKNAPILVLDEATSALDSEAEHLIQQALFDLMKGRTVIAIAHRLSTLTGMDRIIVLDHGRIIEEGTHEALTKAGGTYADLWRRQAGGFVLDVA